MVIVATDLRTYPTSSTGHYWLG